MNVLDFVKKYYKSFFLYFVGITLFNFLYAYFFNDTFSLLSSLLLSFICFFVSLTNSKK